MSVEAPDRLTFFEVRFVDEVGQAIGGLDVELRAGRAVEQMARNPAGIALLEDVESMSASVGVVSIDGIALKAAVPNTVVITPPRDKLFVEILDKKGRVRHAGLPYEISGPQFFSGTTDDQGRLLHASDEVFGSRPALPSMYETSVPAARRWGPHEDTLMLESMPDFGSKSPDEDSVRWFQRTRSFEVDGIIGPETRRQLITEYMAVDGTSLKSPREFDIEISLHGCGENFPLNATGDELDAAPGDNQEDALDRRVGLFFFDAEFGILPPPPGDNSPPGSTAYPEWRKAAVRVVDLEAPDRRQLVLEWPELLTPRVPAETILRVTADRSFEVPWSSGRVQSGMRQFVISAFCN